MKSKEIIAYLTAIILMVSSCHDKLDIQPKDVLTDKSLGFSRNEMEMYSNQFYPSLPGRMSNWAWESDGGTDNNVPSSYGWDGLTFGTQTVPSSGGGWDFSAIRNINFFLENYTRSTEPASTIDKYLGEILFWKAFFYFDLLKDFGDLPWLSKTLDVDSPELYGERISRSVIADSILNILDKSIELLPLESQTDRGRIHKDVASLFKARVALYEGTWEKYHANDEFKGDGRDINRFFVQARDASEAVIESNRYTLYSDFSDPALPEGFSYWRLFSSPSSEIASNPEVLLAREYSSALNLTYGGHQIRNSGGPDGHGITKSLVDAYLCEDGLPKSISPLYLGDETLENVVSNRDRRMKMTVSTPGLPIKIFKGVTDTFRLPLLTNTPWPNTTGYQIYKWLNPFIASDDESTMQSYEGVPLFRLAEALLIAAEAHAELGSCTQQVLDNTINRLRQRVGMPDLNLTGQTEVGFVDPDWKFPELSPLMNEIRRERRVELAFEGFRKDDLFRWAATDLLQAPRLGSKLEQWRDKAFSPTYDVEEISKTKMNAEGYISQYYPIIGEGNITFDPSKNYLYPLPIDQLVMNENLFQNPGY
jgi:starch-binding outer membrane protein, SusD/RagB family